jgi:hypothetical protein
MFCLELIEIASIGPTGPTEAKAILNKGIMVYNTYLWKRKCATFPALSFFRLSCQHTDGRKIVIRNEVTKLF